MKSLYKRLALCYALILVMAASNAYSQELKFISLEVAPWAYFDNETGDMVGIFPDIVDEIETLTGEEIMITLTPYTRINRELETGRQDCTLLIREKERDAITQIGELVFYHPIGVIPTKSIQLNSYDDLYGLRISVLRALKITEQFSSDEKINKERDTNYEMGLRKMKHGRLDAIAGAIPTIQYLAKSNGMEDVLGKPLQLSSEAIYLQCSNNSKKLDSIEKINRAIRKIKEGPVLEKILNSYT